MLVFIDESGDSGMRRKPGSSRYFFVAAVLFEDHEEAEACDRRIERLRAELGLHPGFEFHFNSCSRKFRKAFLSAVSGCAFFYHVFGLNKQGLWSEGFHDKSSFYKYATGLVFENAKPHLSNAKVVIDRSGNNQFRRELARYLRRRINDGEVRLIRKVAMEHSHTNSLLQLADMVCGAVARSYGQKKDRLEYRKLVGHREIRVQLWPK